MPCDRTGGVRALGGGSAGHGYAGRPVLGYRGGAGKPCVAPASDRAGRADRLAGCRRAMPPRSPRPWRERSRLGRAPGAGLAGRARGACGSPFLAAAHGERNATTSMARWWREQARSAHTGPELGSTADGAPRPQVSLEGPMHRKASIGPWRAAAALRARCSLSTRPAAPRARRKPSTSNRPGALTGKSRGESAELALTAGFRFDAVRPRRTDRAFEVPCDVAFEWFGKPGGRRGASGIGPGACGSGSLADRGGRLRSARSAHGHGQSQRRAQACRPARRRSSTWSRSASGWPIPAPSGRQARRRISARPRISSWVQASGPWIPPRLSPPCPGISPWLSPSGPGISPRLPARLSPRLLRRLESALPLASRAPPSRQALRSALLAPPPHRPMPARLVAGIVLVLHRSVPTERLLGRLPLSDRGGARPERRAPPGRAGHLHNDERHIHAAGSQSAPIATLLQKQG
jgi:hypothetical protein